VTIGILSAEEAVAAALESVAQGFLALKVKLGKNVDEDTDRLRRIREAVGPAIALRTDPNAGYDATSLRRYLDGTRDLGLEFCEQPVARGGEAAFAGLDAAARARLAADESVHDLADAGRPRRRAAALRHLQSQAHEVRRHLARAADRPSRRSDRDRADVGLQRREPDLDRRGAARGARFAGDALPRSRRQLRSGARSRGRRLRARGGDAAPGPGPGLGITWEEKAGIGKAFVGLEQP
jgi:hypothetical protein